MLQRQPGLDGTVRIRALSRPLDGARIPFCLCLLPVGQAPSPSHPFRFSICAGSAGVVMNLFAGKIVSPSGICGTENALWPRLLWNFYFPWSCIDLAPIAFQFTQNSTLLKFRRKKKEREPWFMGVFISLGALFLGPNHTALLFAYTMHDARHAVPNEDITAYLLPSLRTRRERSHIVTASFPGGLTTLPRIFSPWDL